MMRTTLIFGMFSLLLVCSLGQGFPNGEVAVVVNGEVITQKELYNGLKACYGKEVADALSMNVVGAVLEEMITIKVIEQRVKDIRVECSTDDYAQNMEFFEEPLFISYKAWTIQNPQSFKKVVHEIMKDSKTEDTKWKTDMEVAWQLIVSDEQLKKRMREEIYRKYYFDHEVFRTRIKVMTTLQKYVDSAVSNQEVAEFAQKERFALEGGKVKISHILRLTRDPITNTEYSKEKQNTVEKEVKDIRKKIKKDLSNFAEIAAEYSEDDLSRYRKGEIGWVPRWPPSIIYRGFLLHLGYIPHWTTSVAEIIDAAYHLELNTVSKPVKSDWGYHLVLVTEKKEGRPVTEED